MVIKEQKKRVFIGISGGVDSAVATALLQKQGYRVVGIFIKIEIGGDCSWRIERREAFRVAAKLDIPLYVIDLSKEYEQAVVSYMLAEYQTGRTPNPDVMCNQQIKFGAFYDWAVANGSDFVATGHYAKIKDKKSKIKDEEQESQMIIPKDKEKDQTYFLWAIERKKLARIIFPLGDLEKFEVRKLARKFDLPNADKPDSQGLCFVGDFDFKKFLRQKIGVKKGDVLNNYGKKIGEHDGAHFFTIGERRGFNIQQKTTNEKPLYVVSKDLVKNILVVSTEPLTISAKKVQKIILENPNWLISTEPQIGQKYQARIRHRGQLADCHLEKTATSEWQVVFEQAIHSPASGQSVVIYDQEVVVGGGIIK